MIEVRGLRRSYGEIEALKGIGFSIRRGEVVGLLGPNGAGKTTAMRILVGALLPSAGRAEVAGFDVCDQPLEVQRRVGYLPENAPVYHDMLVQDYLGFTARMRDLDAGALKRGLSRVVEECSIQTVLTRPVGHLSKGFRQRVGLAAALLHDPEILILDEPTGGLDPNQIMEIRELITRMGKTKTIILSTHILPEVEASCSRAVILIDGRVRADGSLSELTRSLVQVISVRADDAERAAERFGQLANVTRVESSRGDDGYRTFRLRLERDLEMGQPVADVAHEQGWPIRELRRDDRSLEQVFRELTETAEGVEA